jgi:hypothetical protein
LATDIVTVGLEKLLYRRDHVAPTEPRSGGFPQNVDGIVYAELCEDNHFVEHRVAKQFGRVKKCSSNTTAGTPRKASLYPSTSPQHTFSAEPWPGTSGLPRVS